MKVDITVEQTAALQEIIDEAKLEHQLLKHKAREVNNRAFLKHRAEAALRFALSCAVIPQAFYSAVTYYAQEEMSDSQTVRALWTYYRSL